MSNLDFSNVEKPSNLNYLMPGMYMMIPEDFGSGVSSNKNTPYMELTFKCVSENENFNGKLCKDKFYITEKTLPRLQELHMGLTGKKLDKVFSSTEDVINYFNKVMNHCKESKLKKPMVAGGNLSKDGSKIFSAITYSGFFVPEDLFEEMEFEVGTIRFKNALTSVNKEYEPMAVTTESTFVSNSKEQEDDDLPF